MFWKTASRSRAIEAKRGRGGERREGRGDWWTRFCHVTLYVVCAPQETWCFHQGGFRMETRVWTTGVCEGSLMSVCTAVTCVLYEEEFALFFALLPFTCGFYIFSTDAEVNPPDVGSVKLCPVFTQQLIKVETKLSLRTQQRSQQWCNTTREVFFFVFFRWQQLRVSRSCYRITYNEVNFATDRSGGWTTACWVICNGSIWMHIFLIRCRGRRRVGFGTCEFNSQLTNICKNITSNNPANKHPQLAQTHTPPRCYLKPKSLGHISICIHISVKAVELLATPVNSHYQSIWTRLSSAGTDPKSHFIPSPSLSSASNSAPHRHHLLSAEITSSQRVRMMIVLLILVCSSMHRLRQPQRHFNSLIHHN